MSTSTTLKEAVRELAALEDPKMREANERCGDDHGVNLTHLRSLAKRLKTQHDLALQLWATGDTAARLLATLVCRPKAFSASELDAMIRDIHAPKLLDWFIVNVVKPGRHAEELRLRWKDGDDLVGRAGWSLTTERVVKNAESLDLDALLDQIEKQMKQAPAQKQWAMNHCLAEIGIHHPEFRRRAIGIGERLAVLIDYPASPGCTPPYAPIWIAEMVPGARRREVHDGASSRTNLEPEVAKAAAVARQVVERVEAMEMVDWEVSNRFWWREPEIDGDTAAPVGFEAQAAPAKHATALRAEANFERRIGLARACIGNTRP